MRQEAGQTHLSFLVRDAAARDALEAQLPRLRAQFEQSGLALGDVAMGFSDRSGQDAEQPSGAEPRPQRSAARQPADDSPAAAVGWRSTGAAQHLIDTRV